MHIGQISQARREVLGRPGFPQIVARVYLTGRVFLADIGVMNPLAKYGKGAEVRKIDVTKGVMNNAVVIEHEMPILPVSDGVANTQGEVPIQLFNDGPMAAFQADAALIDADIDSVGVEIWAECGSMPPMLVYQGTNSKQPDEDWGSTTFTFRGGLWDIVNVELVADIRVGGLEPIAVFNGAFINRVPDRKSVV